MPIMFNSILNDAGIPAADVRILRHKDKRADPGRGPYELLRDNPPAFESYQSTQDFRYRKRLSAPYWAVFVGTPSDETLFVGIYSAKYLGLLQQDQEKPHIKGEIDRAGTADVYQLIKHPALQEYEKKLTIDWGGGMLAWIQYAAKRNKAVIEVRREFKEREFPGALNFIEKLSDLERLPRGWEIILKELKGVYLLTCPQTKEQYVGKADGADGLWGRWEQYLQTGHGDNVALESRDPSDYQISILEVAGSSATADDIRNMETLWKRKLQSREMGLNRN